MLDSFLSSFKRPNIGLEKTGSVSGIQLDEDVTAGVKMVGSGSGKWTCPGN